MQELLSKESFDRFKLIKSIIKKYPYIDINTTEIQKIKDEYQEYVPIFKVIKTNMHIEDPQFIDKPLLDELKTFNEYIQIKEPSIDIKISYKNKPSDKLINIIYSSVKLFQKLYGNKKVIISIALTEQKRILTTPIIGSINVNGGQTDLRSIDIFRKEELIKVLMHELCHFYELDCENINNNQEIVMKNFNIKTNKIYLSIQEAFTEYLAMLHHIAIISYYTKKSIRLIYHYEKIFSLFQICKILNHYNFKKFEDLYKNKMIQETNVFSYYIIKFFILYKMDNKCSLKNLNEILNDKEIIRLINENMNCKFDNNLRLTFFELK
jgi:hypothetical protein